MHTAFTWKEVVQNLFSHDRLLHYELTLTIQYNAIEKTSTELSGTPSSVVSKQKHFIKSNPYRILVVNRCNL